MIIKRHEYAEYMVIQRLLTAVGGDRVYISPKGVEVRAAHMAARVLCDTDVPPGQYTVVQSGRDVVSLSRVSGVGKCGVNFEPARNEWRLVGYTPGDVQQGICMATKEAIYPTLKSLRIIDLLSAVLFHHPADNKVLLMSPGVSLVLYPPGDTTRKTKVLLVGLPVAHHQALKDRARTSVNRLILDLIEKEVAT